MIKKSYLIFTALCILSTGGISRGDSKLKMAKSNFKLKQLIERSDAIITGRLQYKHTDAMGTHYLIRNKAVLKGDLNDKAPFIVVPFGRSSIEFISEFYAFGGFDRSLYLFFLKKSNLDDKWYEQEEWTGSPYRINGVTNGHCGVIPLEEDAQLINTKVELASLESVDQVDENFVKKITLSETLSENNIKRFIKDYRQRYEEQADIASEKLRRMKRATKKVNKSLKAIKKHYAIDVPAQKNSFISALKLLINDKEPNEDTPKDVREMVKKLKSVNWSEPKKTRAPREKTDTPDDESEFFLELE